MRSGGIAHQLLLDLQHDGDPLVGGARLHGLSLQRDIDDGGADGTMRAVDMPLEAPGRVPHLRERG